MKQSKAQQIIDLRKAGNSKATICSLVKDVSPSEISRALAFLSYHGEYELLRHSTFVDLSLNYTNADYKAMAELSLKNGWSKEATALIFKASRKIVAKAISDREQSDTPLTTHEVQLPEFVSVCGEYDPLHMAYDEERIATNNEAIIRKTEAKKQQDSNLEADGYNLATSSNIDQKPTAPTFPERFGRATAPVMPPSRKKINRRVKQMNQKSQQELIEEHNKNAADAYINGTVEVVDTSNPNKYEDVFSLSHPVRKNKASAEEILEQAGKPSKGRPRIVDIHSKDFDKLPADIQNKHLLFAQKEEEIKNIVRPLIMDSLPMHKVTKSELIAIKVSVVDEVIEEYPDFKLFSILEAAALYYDTYRAYKTRPRKSRDDPYRDVKLLILDIAKQHNYTYGRYRMTAELRNHNVYLCHLTVRRLMKELNLTVVRE